MQARTPAVPEEHALKHKVVTKGRRQIFQSFTTQDFRWIKSHRAQRRQNAPTDGDHDDQQRDGNER